MWFLKLFREFSLSFLALEQSKAPANFSILGALLLRRIYPMLFFVAFIDVVGRVPNGLDASVWKAISTCNEASSLSAPGPR